MAGEPSNMWCTKCPSVLCVPPDYKQPFPLTWHQEYLRGAVCLVDHDILPAVSEPCPVMSMPMGMDQSMVRCALWMPYGRQEMNFHHFAAEKNKHLCSHTCSTCSFGVLCLLHAPINSSYFLPCYGEMLRPSLCSSHTLGSPSRILPQPLFLTSQPWHSVCPRTPVGLNQALHTANSTPSVSKTVFEQGTFTWFWQTET